MAAHRVHRRLDLSELARRPIIARVVRGMIFKIKHLVAVDEVTSDQ